MRDDSETKTPPIPTDSERRRRGRRPADAAARRSAVEQALAELTSARVPFSMGDLAERAGISRATLYRDAGLRDLIGDAGDGPAARPVDAREHRKLEVQAATLAEERRALRRELRATKKALVDAMERIEKLAEENSDRMHAQRAAEAAPPTEAAGEKIRTEAFAEGFQAGARAAQQRQGSVGTRAGGDLLAIASRLPRPALVSARKILAQKLHPDLYVNDPATALLATELFKQINALVAPTAGHTATHR